jgi:hypothetical protein
MSDREADTEADETQSDTEAGKSEPTASRPTSRTKGSEGGVTVKDGGGYFAELLAYAALAEAAGEIADSIGAPPQSGVTLMVNADLELAKLAQLRTILESRLADFERRLAELLAFYREDYSFAVERRGLVETLAAATALLGGAADVVAFFRSSTEIASRAVTLSDRALVALVAQRLTTRGWRVVDPSLALAPTQLAARLDALLRERGKVAARRRTLQQVVQPALAELAEKRVELAEAKASLTALAAAQPSDPEAIRRAQEIVHGIEKGIVGLASQEARWLKAAADLDEALTGCDALVKAVTEGPEGKPSPLEAVAQVDVVHRHSDAALLLLDVVSQGGEIHVSKSVWRTRLTYVGGAVVAFFLTDHGGAIRKAGTVARPAARSVRVARARLELTLPAGS